VCGDIWHPAETWMMGDEQSALRHRHLALRTGTCQRLHASCGVYAFAQTLPQQSLGVILNTQTRAAPLDIDLTELVGAGKAFEGVWSGRR
jgi:hypothetical protein